MLEPCATCSAPICSRNAFYCLDCNKAYHAACLSSLPEHNARISYHPHPPNELHPFPWKCPSCVHCTLCLSNRDVLGTCRTCGRSLCKQCLGKKRGFCGGWGWVCGTDCAKCLHCGVEAPKCQSLQGCLTCWKKVFKRHVAGWCGLCGLLTRERQKCTKCNCDRYFHKICAGDAPYCSDCFEYPHGLTTAKDYIWFWDLGNPHVRTCYRVKSTGHGHNVLLHGHIDDGEPRELDVTFQSPAELWQVWQDAFKETKYNYSLAFKQLFQDVSVDLLRKTPQIHARMTSSEKNGRVPSAENVDNHQTIKETPTMEHKRHRPSHASCFKTTSHDQVKREPKPRQGMDGLKSSDDPNVYIARSSVSGWGLFAAKDFAAGDPIVEYRGEVIGRALADHRERLYNASPLHRSSCYLFALSTELVIDATIRGNHARFINHSCAPNCNARIVDSPGRGSREGHIWIHARQRIKAGSELFYDYKFSAVEGADGEVRVKCRCGSKRCRGFI